MKKLLFAALLGLSALHATVFAQAPVAPTLDAKAWLLYDATSQQVLASHNADQRSEPASLTKLMTAYVAFGALKRGTISLNQKVMISERVYKVARSREESVMFLDPKVPVSVEELLHGMIIQSGNDACVALAELVGGTVENFVAMMNREAQRLGLANTAFKNVAGLTEPGHYTTPRDLAILTAAIIRDFPEYFPIYSKKDYTYNKIKQANRNRLLWLDPTVDGMKTGHTAAAGWCLVSTAQRGPRRVISVVLGTPSDSVRAQESLKLLNFGFTAYDTVKYYSAGQSIAELPVWKGKASKVGVGFDKDLIVAVPRDRAAAVKVQFDSQQPLIAPVPAGSKVGTLKLMIDGQTWGEFPVGALQEVPQAGWFGRTWDAFRLWFK